MKNLMAKLKGADYKGFFLRHGEKIGMAITGVIALVCLAITTWKGFDGTPEKMKDEAAKMEKTLRTNVWPAEKKSEFVLMPADHAVASMRDPVNLGRFMHTVPMSPKLYTYKQPAEEPLVVTATELFVRAGQMPLDVVPPPPEETIDPTVDANPALATGRPGTGSPANPRDRKSDRVDRLAGTATGVVRPGMFPGDRPMGANAAGTPGVGRTPAAAAARGAAGRGGKAALGAGFAMGTAADDEEYDRIGGNRGGMGLGGVGTFTGKARGVRYNVITGIVDRRKQLEALKKALNLDSAGEAPEFLEYVDFKIQRQRALPGPNPWSDDPKSWKDLDTENSIKVLVDEATDFDPDVVGAEYINDAFTSPLPHRLDGDWDFAEVGHPRLPALDLEQREMEAYMNMTAAEIAAEAELEEEEMRYAPRGFRKAQKDPTRLRQRAMGVSGAGERMGGLSALNMRDADDEDGRRGGMRMGGGMRPGAARTPTAPRVPNPATRRMSPMMGANPDDIDAYSTGVTSAAAAGAATAADTLLFRYFDFDIEPGECYRYRVQIVIANPSEDQEYVSSPEVAAGRDRSSDWSKPTPPVIVPKDVEYSLARIARRAGRREGAVLSVVQFDTDVGTLIADNFPVHYGEYVSKKTKSDHLNLSVPSFIAEDVNFSSKEILVDSANGPAIAGAAMQDLKLNQRQLQRLLEGGFLDQAVTLSRFGELIRLDADKSSDYENAKKRYDDQAKEYSDLKDQSTAEAALAKLASRDLLGTMADDEETGMRGRRGALNPLKKTAGGMDPDGGRRILRRRRGSRRGDG